MRSRNFQIPTSEYRVVFYAHCGMTYHIGGDGDRRHARRVMAQLIRRRRRDGFAVTATAEGYEFTEPETAMLVPDTAGFAEIEPVTVPGWECHECGAVLHKSVSVARAWIRSPTMRRPNSDRRNETRMVRHRPWV